MSRLILPFGDRRDEAVAEATHAVPARANAGDLLGRGVNVYGCPVCHKEFRTDHEMEPGCTGPNETTDDHPMAVMTFLRVDPFPRFTLVRP